MMAPSARLSPWERFRRAAAAEGLTVCWVIARERIDPHFAPAAGSRGGAPADLHPGYRRAVVLGSGGATFWNRFREAHPAPPRPEANPLDRYTEQRVEALLAHLREDDPDVATAYPFAHPRQLLPFAALTRELTFLGTAPFGVALDPVHGPWFAWRAAVLTAAAYPESAFPAKAPCAACPAPCEAACPAGAVRREGFRWPDCVEFRLARETCRERCLAREACPVGAAHRYPREAIGYHYRASLRMIERARGEAPPEAARGAAPQEVP